MHRALATEDLIRLIFECFVNEPLHSKSNLLNSSLTCKSWKDLALDGLWNRTLDLHEVFYPLASWGFLTIEKTIRRNITFGAVISLTAPLTKSDWLRYSEYARRVVDVRIRGGWCSGSDSVYHSIMTLRHAGQHFPRVRRINIQDTNVPAANLFLSPSLRSLWIKTPPLINGSRTHVSFLEACGHCSSDLISVRIRISTDLNSEKELQSFSLPLAKFLAGLPRLRSLMILGSDRVIHTTLRSLPPLHSISSIFLDTGYTPRTVDINVNPSTFPQLQCLNLEGRLTSDDLQVLNKLASQCPLREVRLKYNNKHLEGMIALENLSTANVGGSCIKTIEITREAEDRTPTEDVTMSKLQPLSSNSFRLLESLKISGHFCFDIQDSDLKHIAEWCPLLVSFKLETTMTLENQPVPHVTMEGMISFVDLLPRLRHLALAVTTSETGLELKQTAQKSVLETWDVSYSVLTDGYAFAEALAEQFPALHKVYSVYMVSWQDRSIGMEAVDWAKQMTKSYSNVLFIHRFFTVVKKRPDHGLL